MSTYIKSLFRSKWHKEDGLERKIAYARECLERFKHHAIGDKTAVESQNYEIGNTKYEEYMTENQGIWGISYDLYDGSVSIRLDGMWNDVVFDLHDGFWIVDIGYDNYLLTNISDSGDFLVVEDCREIASVLEEKEAWIFDSNNDYANPDDDASFAKWLVYADKIGVKELTKERVKILYNMRHERGLSGFEFSNQYEDTSKIYHLTF